MPAFTTIATAIGLGLAAGSVAYSAVEQQAAKSAAQKQQERVAAEQTKLGVEEVFRQIVDVQAKTKQLKEGVAGVASTVNAVEEETFAAESEQDRLLKMATVAGAAAVAIVVVKRMKKRK